MTPKEKSTQILDKFRTNVVLWSGGSETETENVRQCALIVVKEVIEQWDYIDTYLADMNGELNPNLKYWYDVREEINNWKIKNK